MDIDKVQDEIIEEFQAFDDWMDKYNYLIEISRDLPEYDLRYRNDEYVINGCQSKVWLKADLKNEKIEFNADSDAIIVKGIIALLLRVYTNRTPQEILDSKLYFVDSIGLRQNLSPTRSNGLLAMVKQIKLYALAYKTKMENNGK